MKKISVIVPTKDRPSELRRLMESLARQTRPPDEVIIVDSGQAMGLGIGPASEGLAIRHISYSPPSAAGQRNAGIEAAAPDSDLIGFFDDDIVLEDCALASMMSFWDGASGDVGGASFNLVNGSLPSLAWLKYLPLSERLGFYRKRAGMILPSGFQTIVQYLPSNEVVQWFPASASIWRKELLSRFRFDEWFEGYSYLEDVDFCHRIGKICRLMIVAEAKYLHLPAPSGRPDAFLFGVREVKNRLYLVRKHSDFSLAKCYAALLLRILISLVSAVQEKKVSYIPRISGNIVALLESIWASSS